MRRRNQMLLSSKENTERLIRGKRAERVGLYDGFWPETLEKWRKQGHLIAKDPETGEEKPVDFVEYFGFDINWMGSYFDNMPIRGYKEVLEETEEWQITRNGAGAVFKNWKHKSGTPEHIDFSMTSREIWERDYRPYLLEVDRERLSLESLRKRYKLLKEKGDWMVYAHMFIWESMRMSMGDGCMFETLALDPGWIHDYNRVYTDFYKAHFKTIFEEAGKPDAVWLFEDLGYKNGLFCSPATLERLFLPYYKEFIDFMDSYDIPVILHSCGGIEKALPLIVDAGFAALNPMEVKAGCDALRFAEKYGDRIAFIGGLDARMLESGDKDLIKRETIRLVRGMKEIGARYFFGSDHSISPNVDFEDFSYAIEVYRENMFY
jgi:uroporphyrinogen decarboxylase